MYKIILVILLVVFTACTNVPQPIAYGSDGCHFCRMTVVDKQHAAQLMTKKGRTYVFDATECMLNYLKEIDNTTVANFLVNDYDEPGTTIDATKATYLISENIPSPMGAYISAFSSIATAKEVQNKNGGDLFQWHELQERFK